MAAATERRREVQANEIGGREVVRSLGDGSQGGHPLRAIPGAGPCRQEAIILLADDVKGKKNSCLLHKLLGKPSCLFTKVIRYFHGFAVQKDSEFKDLLNYHIDGLREKGVVAHLSKRNIDPILKTREIMCANIDKVRLFFATTLIFKWLFHNQ